MDVCIYFYINTCVLCIYNFPGGSDGIEFACNVEDPGVIPGSGEANGNPPQYFCLENSMDWGAYSP